MDRLQVQFKNNKELQDCIKEIEFLEKDLVKQQNALEYKEIQFEMISGNVKHLNEVRASIHEEKTEAEYKNDQLVEDV